MIKILKEHPALIALSSALAIAASIGCSSEGSSFGGGGMGSTNPTSNTGGNGNNTSNPMGGSGNNTTNPMGGSGNNTTNPMGGSGQQGGNGPGGGTGGTGVDPGPVCPKPAPEICHEFIANDNSRHVINYVNEFTSTKPGNVEWSTNLNDASTNPNSPRTLEIVDNAAASTGKAILASIKEGFVELDVATGAILGNPVKLQNTTNISGACRLPDGNTALAADTKVRIVGPTGAAVREFNIPTGGELRAINRHPTTGNFWLSRTEKVYEINDQGQTQWDANLGAGAKGYSVWWREGGGAYATTGDPSTVVEIDASKTILKTIGGKATFGFLDFFSGFVRTSEGHYIVANWLGHLSNPGADTPHVVEFDQDNKLVWQWGNQTYARQITNVYVFR